MNVVGGRFALSIRGVGLDFAAITDGIGLTPVKLVKQGEHISPSTIAPTDGWLYHHEFTETIDDGAATLAQLLQEVAPGAPYARALQSHPDVTKVEIDCYVRSDWAHVWFDWPVEIIRLAHQVGLNLDVHILSFGDATETLPLWWFAAVTNNHVGIENRFMDMADRVTFSIRGTSLDFDAISKVVGLPPTHTVAQGEEVRGQPAPADGWFHSRTVTEEARTMVDVLTGLLNDLRPQERTICQMNARPEVQSLTVDCSVRSDAGQMGVLLPITVFDRLQALNSGLMFYFASEGWAENE